jgi:hypothetical protein
LRLRICRPALSYLPAPIQMAGMSSLLPSFFLIQG